MGDAMGTYRHSWWFGYIISRPFIAVGPLFVRVCYFYINYGRGTTEAETRGWNCEVACFRFDPDSWLDSCAEEASGQSSSSCRP